MNPVRLRPGAVPARRTIEVVRDESELRMSADDLALAVVDPGVPLPRLGGARADGGAVVLLPSGELAWVDEAALVAGDDLALVSLPAPAFAVRVVDGWTEREVDALSRWAIERVDDEYVYLRALGEDGREGPLHRASPDDVVEDEEAGPPELEPIVLRDLGEDANAAWEALVGRFIGAPVEPGPGDDWSLLSLLARDESPPIPSSSAAPPAPPASAAGPAESLERPMPSAPEPALRPSVPAVDAVSVRTVERELASEAPLVESPAVLRSWAPQTADAGAVTAPPSVPDAPRCASTPGQPEPEPTPKASPSLRATVVDEVRAARASALEAAATGHEVRGESLHSSRGRGIDRIDDIDDRDGVEPGSQRRDEARKVVFSRPLAAREPAEPSAATAEHLFISSPTRTSATSPARTGEDVEPSTASRATPQARAEGESERSARGLVPARVAPRDGRPPSPMRTPSAPGPSVPARVEPRGEIRGVEIGAIELELDVHGRAAAGRRPAARDVRVDVATVEPTGSLLDEIGPGRRSEELL